MMTYIGRKYAFFVALPRNLKSLILSSFFMAFGSFMVTPFIAIFLKEQIHMTAPHIGVVVAFAAFIQFGGGILGGIAAEKYGLKQCMVAALLTRTAGFMLLSLSVLYPALAVPCVFFVCAGSALYMPANKAYVVSVSDPKDRPMILALSSAAFNTGMACGPLLAALFISSKPDLLFSGVGALFAVLAIAHQVELPKLAKGAASRLRFPSLRLIDFLTPAVAIYSLTFYIYFYFQNFMGLYAERLFGSKLFGAILFANFAILILVQLFGARKIAAISYSNLVIGSFTLMATGLAITAFENFAAVLIGVAVMTVGQAGLFLRGDLELVDQFPNQPALAFGVQRLSAGIGGFASGLAGGFLFDRSHGIGSFWVLVGAQCFVILITYWFWETRYATAR